MFAIFLTILIFWLIHFALLNWVIIDQDTLICGRKETKRKKSKNVHICLMHLIENDMSNVWAHSHSTIYTRKITKWLRPSKPQRWELQVRKTKKEGWRVRRYVSNMYAVEQSIGIPIINRSFAPYTELRLPGQGVQSVMGYEIPGFRIVASDKSWVDVVPVLTIAKNRIEGGKKK